MCRRFFAYSGNVIGGGETSTPDPFCYLGSPGMIGYVFRLHDGVLRAPTTIVVPLTATDELNWSFIASSDAAVSSAFCFHGMT
jgi:hypothetical protein